MSLDERVEKEKRKLNAVVTAMPVCDKYVIRLSQRLDRLIVKRMRRDLA